MSRDDRRVAAWTTPYVHRVAGSERYSDGLHDIMYRWSVGDVTEALRVLDWDDIQRAKQDTSL
jgi:hypothetical protein